MGETEFAGEDFLNCKLISYRDSALWLLSESVNGFKL